MRPTPPGPTLFPYTTLFRSPWEAVEKRRYWRGRLRTFSCRFRAELMPTAMRWLPILSLTGLVCAVAFSDKWRSEEHTSELQSLTNLVCRLLLEKENTTRSAC